MTQKSLNNTKSLGVIVDKHLTWKEHIHYLNIKLTRALGIISKLRYNVPRHLLVTIYSAFFKPHIDYCVNIWSCTCNTNLQPINVSMKKAIRLITFNKYNAHAEPLDKSLNILNLRNTMDLNLGKFMWDVNNKGLPKCLSQILNFDEGSKSSRNITHSKKYIPLCRTKYKISFSTTSGTILWNNIPENIKELKSKNNLQNHSENTY